MMMTSKPMLKRDALLFLACLLAAVIVVQFDVEIAAFVQRHMSGLLITAMFGGLCLAGYYINAAGEATASPAPGGIPRTWTRTPLIEAPCDLCGDKNVTFICGDHNLILCTPCTHRHDRFSACNIRYVPTVHESHGRHA